MSMNGKSCLIPILSTVGYLIHLFSLVGISAETDYHYLGHVLSSLTDDMLLELAGESEKEKSFNNFHDKILGKYVLDVDQTYNKWPNYPAMSVYTTKSSTKRIQLAPDHIVSWGLILQ